MYEGENREVLRHDGHRLPQREAPRRPLAREGRRRRRRPLPSPARRRHPLLHGARREQPARRHRRRERPASRPREWADRMDEAFRLRLAEASTSRTTSGSGRPSRATRAPRQELFRRAQAQRRHLQGAYAGWYCPNCNNYYADEDLVDGRCPDHPTLRPEWLEEENYFFALSSYERQLSRADRRGPDFVIPAVWRSEVAAMLRSLRGLQRLAPGRGTSPGASRSPAIPPGDLRLVRRPHQLRHRRRLPR